MSKRIGLWQMGAVLLVSLAAFLLAGAHGALSALAGGFAVWVGGQLGALSMKRSRTVPGSAGVALLVLLKAEAIKIVVVALLLLLTFKLYGANLVPLALIVGLAVAALLSGVGIMRVNEQKMD
ncbi:MAG: ATP synthase subunit I [Methylobacillus sp.]|jgi:ATP synthase protein I|nr:ATP synthase subunit I [Methylobacillus sp.]